MSDSSDEEWAAEWIPYSQRNEWADISPIAQDDGENPVVAIAYSAKCKYLPSYVLFPIFTVLWLFAFSSRSL